MLRLVSSALVLLGLAVFMGAAVNAGDKGNTHTGKFISATGVSFKMESKDGKEHNHSLANGAKVIGADGKACRLTDFRKGQLIQVTTRLDDKSTATLVQALKERNK